MVNGELKCVHVHEELKSTLEKIGYMFVDSAEALPTGAVPAGALSAEGQSCAGIPDGLPRCDDLTSGSVRVHEGWSSSLENVDYMVVDPAEALLTGALPAEGQSCAWIVRKFIRCDELSSCEIECTASKRTKWSVPNAPCYPVGLVIDTGAGFACCGSDSQVSGETPCPWCNGSIPVTVNLADVDSCKDEDQEYLTGDELSSLVECVFGSEPPSSSSFPKPSAAVPLLQPPDGAAPWPSFSAPLSADMDTAYVTAPSPSLLLKDMDTKYLSKLLGYFNLRIENVPLGTQANNEGKVTYLEVKKNKVLAKFNYRVGRSFQNIHLGVYNRVEDAAIAKTIFLVMMEDETFEKRVLRISQTGISVLDDIVTTMKKLSNGKKNAIKLIREAVKSTRYTRQGP